MYTGRAAVRAGILVTGTEVLTGIISDRNGPWVSERLRELGVDVCGILVVGDRPDDVLAGLSFFRTEGVQLIVTSGGLGPTADDLTAEMVGRFQGREMVLDSELETVIEAIIARLGARWRNVDPAALAAANRKQAMIPSGAAVLAPVGTAPGLVVPPADGENGPVVVVLPGPPSELQPMWQEAVAQELVRTAIAEAPVLHREMMRLFGIPEAEISVTLRAAAETGIDLAPLEITTCLRRAEIEVSTRFSPAAADSYAALKAFIIERHGTDVVYSPDGETVDAMIAAALVDQGASVATAESCTGGMLAARLTDLAGSSAYVLGGVVAYANAAKTGLVGVPAETIDTVGAVSAEVALALADGARDRFGAVYGVGITGIAGPGGGSEEKPVGTVWFAVSAEDRTLVRRVRLPGDRTAVRDRATSVAMHLLLAVIRGGGDPR